MVLLTHTLGKVPNAAGQALSGAKDIMDTGAAEKSLRREQHTGLVGGPRCHLTLSGVLAGRWRDRHPRARSQTAPPGLSDTGTRRSQPAIPTEQEYLLLPGRCVRNTFLAGFVPKCKQTYAPRRGTARRAQILQYSVEQH